MKTMGKVTLYFTSDFGMGVNKLEVKSCSLEVKQHAQYEKGIYVEFLAPRQRRTRCFTQAYSPSLVILDGWGHPDPDEMFLPEEPGKTEGVTVRRGRYMAHDPRWQSDFDQKLAAYLEEKGPKVLLEDFRGHQPGCRGMVGTCSCFSCWSDHDASN